MAVLKGSNAIYWTENKGAVALSTTVTGTARDTGNDAGTPSDAAWFHAIFYGVGGTGTLQVHCSDDGVTWYQIGSTSTTSGVGARISLPVTARFMRASYVNGGVALTTSILTCGFTALGA